MSSAGKLAFSTLPQHNFAVSTIPLLDVLPMESFNGQRLYEILWHDSHGGEKKVLTYNIADLKFSMGMRVLEQKGSKRVWTEKYKAWRDFRKMLERACNEFETHGRLHFSFDAIRQGRAIQQVRFHLSLIAGAELEQHTPAAQAAPLTLEELGVADDLRSLGYVQDADAFVLNYGYEIVARAVKLGRTAAVRGNSSGRPIKNLPGFVQHLVVSGAASRSLKLDVAGAGKKAGRTTERELTEVIKNAFEAYRNETAEEVFKTLDEDMCHALPEMLRVELETQSRLYVIDVLEKADWQGAQYQIARNAYLLDLYRDEVSEAVHDIEMFVEDRQLLAGQPAEVTRRVLDALKDELGV